jgi:two-component system, cell cycle sensor histidine kinase and response regulator CckA
MKAMRGAFSDRPLAVGILYFFASCFWIIGTDKVLHSLQIGREAFILLSIAKGIFFLAITAVLFFLILRRLHQANAMLQEESQAALRKSELHFRLLVEQASDGIFVADEKGQYVDVNSAGAEMLGYSREEVLKLSIPDIVMEEELPRVPREVERLSESKLVMTEWKLRRKDGTSFIGELSGRKLPDGRLQAIVRDITERRRAEHELRESKRWLDAAMEAGNLAVWSHDLLTGELVTNARGKRILGLPEEATVTLPDLLARVVPEDRRPLESESENLDIRLEFRLASPSGIRWVYACGKGRRDASGRRVGSSGVVIDITEKRLAEEQLKLLQQELQQAQKMEAVGQLAGGVAHDFNNLMHVVMSYAELAGLLVQADSPVKRHLHAIMQAAKRATDVTGQLLAFGRKQILNPRVFCVNESVMNTSKMLGRLIGEDIILKTELDPDLASTKADPGQVEQVIMNLAVNARDAMPEGGKLTISTKNVSIEQPHSAIPAGDYVRLSVRDSGCGMPESVKARIFEPFFTTKGQGKGTGLGLATVYGIVKQSEGYIECSSVQGEGTQFDVYFPATGPIRHDANDEDGREYLASHEETILLVEDDDAVRDSAKEMLQSLGYRVLVAQSGSEATEISRTHNGPIQLVLTDVVMPGISGSQLATHLQKGRPETKFLFMSGYTDDAMLRQGIIQSAVPFLQKPFSLRGIAKKVDEVLRAPARMVPMA